MNKISLLIILSFFTCLSFAQQTRNLRLVKPLTENPTIQTRKAMVIGMSDYGAGKNLNNTLNDADDMADVLTRLGFQVTLLKNNDLRNLKTNLANWYYTIEGNDMAIFYFAGHGMEVNGVNYLIPVEAELNSQTDVEFNALNVNQVLGNMDEKRVDMKLLILDACRDNQFKRSWGRGSEEKGLAQMSAPKGTYIAFAASPGATAMDGGNYDLNNGVFTHFLKQEILKAGASIDEIFNNVTGYVATLTHNQQVPFKNSSLTKNFYFIPPDNDKPILPPAPAVVVKGELKVNSTPEQDAIIMIDGIRQTEKTPVTFPLNAGSYRVVVSKEWYKEAQQEVQITGGQITEINVPLMPNFATITIRSVGNETISIDGEVKATGNWQGKLKTGLHTLVVEKESRKSYKSTINVQAGNDQSLEIPELPAFELVYGTLNITTCDINATVYVDGVKRSKTTPCVVNDLLTGKRQIQLIPDDSNYQAYETVVDISEGKTTNLEAVLVSASKKTLPAVDPSRKMSNPVIEEKPVKPITIIPDMLIAQGTMMYGDGQELTQNEVRNLMANTDALSLYDNGLSTYRKGKNCSTAGWILMGGGVGLLMLSSGGRDNAMAQAFAATVVGTGIVMEIAGIVIKTQGKENIQKSVNEYNNGRKTSSMELKFGFFRNGVGLALNF